MAKARFGADGICTWVEVCFCATPLQEERPYWEQYFDLLQIKDAHARKNCRDANGTEPCACCNCDCTKKLEERLEPIGHHFLNSLKAHSLAAELKRAETSRLHRFDCLWCFFAVPVPPCGVIPPEWSLGALSGATGHFGHRRFAD